MAIQDFSINTSHDRTLNINTDPSCCRTSDPDTALNCSSGPEVTMAVGSLQYFCSVTLPGEIGTNIYHPDRGQIQTIKVQLVEAACYIGVTYRNVGMGGSYLQEQK